MEQLAHLGSCRFLGRRSMRIALQWEIFLLRRIYMLITKRGYTLDIVIIKRRGFKLNSHSGMVCLTPRFAYQISIWTQVLHSRMYRWMFKIQGKLRDRLLCSCTLGDLA